MSIKTSPSFGRICTHWVLGGICTSSPFKSDMIKASFISPRLHVPSMYDPLLNTYADPTPTVRTLGSVVAGSLYKGPCKTTIVWDCKISV